MKKILIIIISSIFIIGVVAYGFLQSEASDNTKDTIISSDKYTLSNSEFTVNKTLEAQPKYDLSNYTFSIEQQP